MNVKNTKKHKYYVSKEFLTEEYIIKHRSLPEIAKQLNIPYRSLFDIKESYNIPTLPPDIWIKGKRISPRTEFKKGLRPWNTGLKGVTLAWNKGKTLNEEQRRNVSEATKKAMANPSIKEKIKKTQFKKGITPWNKNKTGVYSEKTRQEIRQVRLKQIFPKKSTNIELILFEILENLKIAYKKHTAIKNICQADAFIEPNIVLFADGDYWHCNPNFYLKPKTQAQMKNIKRDYEENNKLIKDGFIIGRFWEYDLINNLEECKNRIIKLVGDGKNV